MLQTNALLLAAVLLSSKLVFPPASAHIWAVMAIALAVLTSVRVMILLKYLHDYVRARNSELVQRYMDIAGRVTALVVGTFAVEMIMRGLTTWMVSVR